LELKCDILVSIFAFTNSTLVPLRLGIMMGAAQYVKVDAYASVKVGLHKL
jgi:hypothetical protein